MKYSEKALDILIAKESGIITTSHKFWKEFSQSNKIDFEKLKNYLKKESKYDTLKKGIINELETPLNKVQLVCSEDEQFPMINRNVIKNSQKPYLFFYEGDISLLHNLSNNVAVIGVLNPDEQIKKREIEIVSRLVEMNLVIVSGLAKGCDTIAHEVCVNMKGKTIAVLPSPINKVYPHENADLARRIVENGGLLISEYYSESKNKFDSVNRLVSRDRLQAMFSKAIILIASYREGAGDSGSRHAMTSAKEYEISRYIMYNEYTDSQNSQMGLNIDWLNEDKAAKILRKESIKDLATFQTNYIKTNPIQPSLF